MSGSIFSIFSDPNLGKTDKWILFCVFGSIPFGLIILFFYGMFFGPSTEQLIRQRDLQENFSGRVDSAFNDERNHNVRMVVFKNGDQYPIPPEWEMNIEAGDSLSKEKNSYILQVFKKDHRKLIFDYRSNYKK